MISITHNSFYSGFSLESEEELFSQYIINSDFVVSGFSYGAQKAFEYVLNSKRRIDKIQLFSPAFFQNRDIKYKKMQCMFFKKDFKNYCDNFLLNCTFPSKINMSKYFKKGTSKELEALLYYVWDENKLLELVNNNINIEVYLGAKDKIIDCFEAREFFKKYATVYTIKNVGHILQ